jgi:hypothetical protein
MARQTYSRENRRNPTVDFQNGNQKQVECQLFAWRGKAPKMLGDQLHATDDLASMGRGFRLSFRTVQLTA